MFKVINKDTRMMPGVVLVSFLLTFLLPCPGVSMVNFEQVNAEQVTVFHSKPAIKFLIKLSLIYSFAV